MALRRMALRRMALLVTIIIGFVLFVGTVFANDCSQLSNPTPACAQKQIHKSKQVYGTYGTISVQDGQPQMVGYSPILHQIGIWKNAVGCSAGTCPRGIFWGRLYFGFGVQRGQVADWTDKSGTTWFWIRSYDPPASSGAYAIQVEPSTGHYWVWYDGSPLLEIKKGQSLNNWGSFSLAGTVIADPAQHWVNTDFLSMHWGFNQNGGWYSAAWLFQDIYTRYLTYPCRFWFGFNPNDFETECQ